MFNFKKKYGQNFLVDKNIVNKIVDSVDKEESNLVIEIGCGDGRLTSSLVKEFDNVLCYEIDTELKDTLLDKFGSVKNVDFIFNDFLLCNVKEDVSKYDVEHIYVIANLPYYITTPIIEKIINSGIDIDKMCIMVQKEVADRFSAKPGTKDYGSISVYLNYYFDIKRLFVVSRNSFIPKPNVDSAVVLFSKKDRFFVKDEDVFFKLVRDSFKFKRKTIRNNLKDYDLEVIEKVLEKYSFDLNVRAEALSLEIFIDIANRLANN